MESFDDLELPEYKPLEYWTERGKRYQAQFQYDKKKQIQEEILLSALKNISFSTVLEVGCGFGRITKLLLDRFPISQYVALDLSPDQIENAKRYIGSADNVSFVVSDIQSFVPSSKYDLVIACEVLLHVKPDEIRGVINKLLSFSSHYFAHVDWYENQLPEKAAPHNFMHNYPQIYSDLGKEMKMIPVRKQNLLKTEDAKQCLFLIDT